MTVAFGRLKGARGREAHARRRGGGGRVRTDRSVLVGVLMFSWALRAVVRKAFGALDALLLVVWLNTDSGRSAKAAIRLAGRKRRLEPLNRAGGD